jgi:hypothetical protein
MTSWRRCCKGERERARARLD